MSALAAGLRCERVIAREAALGGIDTLSPFRPASAANLRFCEKLRFSFGTLSPPFRAITRCFSRSIEAKPLVEVEDFLGISVASAIVSSLELRHYPKDGMFGSDKGFIRHSPDHRGFGHQTCRTC